MTIKLLAQITENGYIARTDGELDWCLNPESFGIDMFFQEASAILDYEDGKYIVENKDGKISIDTTLTSALSRLKNISGYVAFEATPCSLPLVQTLMSGHYITEIHLIQVAIEFDNGIRFPVSELQSKWQQVSTRIAENDDRVLYSVFCKEY